LPVLCIVALITPLKHKTGKLGFSAAGQEYMNIEDDSYFKVGFNSQDKNDENIYMVPTSEEKGAFKVAKAGGYYYMNLKNIFDKRELDYQNESFIYDIKRQEANGMTYYILKKRK
jgi:hypothetical protein